MSRVQIWDEPSPASRPKTKKIEDIFKPKEVIMTEQKTDEIIKTAIQEEDFKALIASKKAKISTSAEPVSLKIGVVGSGQAGGRLAEVFFNFGYSAVAINTARQDLELLGLPADNKFHMNYSIGAGGSGKDISVGRAAFEDSAANVKLFIAEKLRDVDVYLATFSLGGGSGSGSAEALIDLLNEFGKPVICICAVPGSFDDTQSKYNAIQTLARLADQASAQKINSMILVDNARLETLYSGLSQADFWKTTNLAIAEPLHLFNSMSAKPTKYEALDSADFSISLLESGGCTIFGSNKISRDQYENNDLALVEAVVENLERGLFADGFDLKEAQRVGVLITASEKVLEKIPFSNIAFIFKYVSEEFQSAGSFKGVYGNNSESDDITVHFMFSGLGLPRSRVEALKQDAQKNMDVLLAKKNSAPGKMSIDLGKDKGQATAADSMMQQIKKNQSPIGKLLGTNTKKGVIDRRR